MGRRVGGGVKAVKLALLNIRFPPINKCCVKHALGCIRDKNLHGKFWYLQPRFEKRLTKNKNPFNELSLFTSRCAVYWIFSCKMMSVSSRQHSSIYCVTDGHIKFLSYIATKRICWEPCRSSLGGVCGETHDWCSRNAHYFVTWCIYFSSSSCLLSVLMWCFYNVACSVGAGFCALLASYSARVCKTQLVMACNRRVCIFFFFFLC